MLTASCPACGAEIRFLSSSLPVRVCDYCRSTIVRSADELTAMGKVANLPEDVSPLQIGTRGQLPDKGDTTGFELVGRIRWRWSGGAWNEWVMLLDDGTQGWLGEAMGRFMLLFERQMSRKPKIVQYMAADAHIAIGQTMTIDGIDYETTDVRRVDCVASEGEIPFSTPAGLSMLSVDLSGPDGRCASVQKDRGQVAVYTGRYATLAELRPTQLRAIEGWAMPDFAR